MAIYHISDIHIRRQNYANILHGFQKLLGVMEPGSTLVIAGDIFDTRSYLSSDDINLFTRLAALLEQRQVRTIMIPGDHDINSRAMHAQDNISLLLRDYEYVTLAKDELVQVGDETFWTGSWKDVKTCSGSAAIMYGVVSCGNGKNADVHPISDLAGFKYAMLGGVHKHQFLTPNIAYSGSFVQRDADEGLTHGYVRWENGTGEFVAIPQKTVYLTLLAQNNLCDPLPDVRPSYISIRHVGCDEEWLAEYMTRIRRRYGMSVSFVMDMQLDAPNDNDVPEASYVEAKSTPESAEIIERLRATGAPDDVAADVLAMYKASHRTQKARVMWDLVALRWSNIYSYGEGNHINFAEMGDLVSIVGPNKIGKSAILDILINVLFDTYVRGGIADVINKSAKQGTITAAIRVNGADFTIIKTFKGRKAATQIKKNGVAINGDAYGYLAGLGLGTGAEFISMVTALQRRQFLVDMKKENQARMIAARLGLDEFTESHANARVRRNAISARLRALGEPEELPDAGDAQKKYAAATRRMEALRSQISRYKACQDELKTLLLRSTRSPAALIDLIRANDTANDAADDRDIVDIANDAADDRDIVDIANDIRALEKEKHIIIGAVHPFGKRKSDHSVAARFKRVGLAALVRDIRAKEKKISAIWTPKFADDCAECQANSKSYDRTIRTKRKLLGEVADLKKVILGGSGARIDVIDASIAELSDELSRSEAAAERRAKIKEREELREELRRSERIRDLQQGMRGMGDIVKAKYVEFTRLERDIPHQKMRLQTLETRIAEAEKTERTRAELIRQRQVLTCYMACIDTKTGIPAERMQTACRVLTKKCCDVLGDVANFGVEFTHNKRMQIYIFDYSNEKRNRVPAGMGSGYQKFVLDLVMRVVFSEMSQASNPRLLFVDEGFGALDSANFSNICKCLSRLKTRFRTMVLISHIDEIQTYITEFVRVKKDERGLSIVQYGSR